MRGHFGGLVSILFRLRCLKAPEMELRHIGSLPGVVYRESFDCRCYGELVVEVVIRLAVNTRDHSHLRKYHRESGAVELLDDTRHPAARES